MDEGEDGSPEAGYQTIPAMDLLSEMQLPCAPQQEIMVSRVDLAPVAYKEEKEQSQASCILDTPSPDAAHNMLNLHTSPSTPHLHHPGKPEGSQLSASPTPFHGIGEGRVPLWIKWRGKWQAGLQCSLEDCPGQTIKAMPTYGRKSYIVVFFPNSKSFAWTDWQLVCPISEDPEPLAFGTHDSGRDSLFDLNGARQYMLRKISSALLDISDRLPVQAVVDCARDVSFWKDFAKDAARSVTYQELGHLLAKMQRMILPAYMKESWMQNYAEDWKRQCESVETAASMEKLAKDLKGAVVWDEVGKLWDQVEQTNLDSEWTTWKENANGNPCNETDASLTGHRRPFDPPHCIHEESNGQALPVYDGIEDFDHQNLKRMKIEDKPSISELNVGSLPGIDKNAYILSLSAVANTALSWSSRWHEGAVGERHLGDQKGKLPMQNVGGDDSNGVLCSGVTKFGRRCTHKARDGSIFCLKHTSKLSNGENLAAMPLSVASLGSMELQPHLAAPGSIGNWTQNDEQGSTGQSSSTSLKASKLASKIAARFTNGTRCVGWCGNGTQCSHRAKLGFSYCEKHLPSSSRGQERARASDDAERSQYTEDAMCLTRVRELVNEYIRVRLQEDGAQSSQHLNTWQKIIDAVCSEVGGNLNVSETLCKIISLEMEILKKHFEPDVMEPQITPPSSYPRPLEQGSCSMPSVGGDVGLEHLSNVELLKQVSMKSTASIPRYRCKLCAQEFVELNVLGQHWRACHKKEAQQYFRGFTCQHCNLPFTNKKGLYRHRNSHHPGMSSPTKSSLLALCIICSGQFMSFDDLWQHVVCSHPDQMCAYWPVTTDLNLPLTHWKPPGLEVFDFGKCSDCGSQFSTYAELQQHKEVAHKSNKLSFRTESFGRIPDTKDELKYKCKVCGLRFRLLPDLGRHHQAEHKPAQVMRLKSSKEDAMPSGPVQELNSVMGCEKDRKKLQKLHIRRAPAGQTRAENPITAQQQALHCEQNISIIEGYVGPKLEGFPSNSDILAVAKSACCKNKLYSVLQKKYVSLPDRLASKAAMLCSEANIRLEFYREGYVCPNSCTEIALSSTNLKSTIDSTFVSANGSSTVPHMAQPKLENECFAKNKDITLNESHIVLTALPGTKQCLSDKLILCEDMSFGKERVPIPCVVDKDTLGPCNCPMCTDNQTNHTSEALMPWSNFTYVTQRTLDPSLGLDTESSGLGCGCQGLKCSSAHCEHVYIFDNDNTDAQDIYGRPMVGRFPYDSQGCIILEEGYLVYECNSLCNCHESCHNRILQKGVQVKLEVYKTRHKGWAVRAAQRIPRGTFVCEYIGEVLDDREANQRGERYDKEGCSYLYDIDAHIHMGRRGRSKPFVIDATKYGNVARFINHSCSPNLVNYQVLVESMDCQLAHIGLYATRDINIGEELAYDYRYKLLPGKGCPCHCGASDCRGRLY